MRIQRRHSKLDSSCAGDGSRAASQLQAMGEDLHYSPDDGDGPPPAALRVVPPGERERRARTQRGCCLRADGGACACAPTTFALEILHLRVVQRFPNIFT